VATTKEEVGLSEEMFAVCELNRRKFVTRDVGLRLTSVFDVASLGMRVTVTNARTLLRIPGRPPKAARS
jgi:hypothetical protein